MIQDIDTLLIKVNKYVEKKNEIYLKKMLEDVSLIESIDRLIYIIKKQLNMDDIDE